MIYIKTCHRLYTCIKIHNISMILHVWYVYIYIFTSRSFSHTCLISKSLPSVVVAFCRDPTQVTKDTASKPCCWHKANNASCVHSMVSWGGPWGFLAKVPNYRSKFLSTWWISDHFSRSWDHWNDSIDCRYMFLFGTKFETRPALRV